MDRFLGKFKQVSSENFDAYLKEMGVNFAVRKIMGSSNPQVEIEKCGENEYMIKSATAVKNFEIKFKLGEPFHDVAPSGVKYNTTFTLEDSGKLRQLQKAIDPKDKDNEIIREVDSEGNILMQLTCNGVTCTRKLQRL